MILAYIYVNSNLTEKIVFPAVIPLTLAYVSHYLQHALFFCRMIYLIVALR